MSFSLGDRINFLAPGGTDNDARHLAEQVVHEMYKREDPPDEQQIIHALTTLLSPGSLPKGRRIGDADTQRIREMTPHDFAEEFLFERAIDCISPTNYSKKDEPLALIYAVRPLDKDAAVELVKLVLTHFKINDDAAQDRIITSFTRFVPDDWKAVAEKTEAARAITKLKIRKIVLKSLFKSSNGKVKFPAEIHTQLMGATHDALAEHIAQAAVAPVLSELVGYKVKGILKINQQLALYKGIREDATSDTVIDKVLAHVLADKLMKKVVVVDATADERGESVQVGEKRGAGGVVRVAEGC